MSIKHGTASYGDFSTTLVGANVESAFADIKIWRAGTSWQGVGTSWLWLGGGPHVQIIATMWTAACRGHFLSQSTSWSRPVSRWAAARRSCRIARGKPTLAHNNFSNCRAQGAFALNAFALSAHCTQCICTQYTLNSVHIELGAFVFSAHWTQCICTQCICTQCTLLLQCICTQWMLHLQCTLRL